MDQYALIHESLNEALTDAVRALGGSKKVGAALWPAIPMDEAKNRLNACLNITRPEKLSLSEILFILRWAREIGYHGAMHFIGQECGYHVEPVEPADEHAKLQRDYIEAVKLQAKIAARLEKLALPTIKAVA